MMAGEKMRQDSRTMAGPVGTHCCQHGGILRRVKRAAQAMRPIRRGQQAGRHILDHQAGNPLLAVAGELFKRHHRAH